MPKKQSPKLSLPAKVICGRQIAEVKGYLFLLFEFILEQVNIYITIQRLSLLMGCCRVL